MSRLGSVLALCALPSMACHSERTLDDYAATWSEAVCARWSACGCEPADCEAEQRGAFIERWDAEDDTDRPDPTCFDARITAIDELACDFAETEDPFAWERAACPLRPNFRGVSEPCEVPEPGGTLRGPCESGLVCDATTRTCVDPARPPGPQQRCVTSGDGSPDDWLCAAGLTCTDGLCIESADPTRTPSPPIACTTLDTF